jgi:hypothetical protein
MGSAQIKKILFVGQERSRLAVERGVRWEDEAQCANQLFRAIRAVGIRPEDCEFVNLFEDSSDGVAEAKKTVNKKGANKIKRWAGAVVGLGKIVGRRLKAMGIEHREMVHPAARGSIRLKKNYIRMASARIGDLA